MTVANALSIITFHVVSDADIMTKLQTELKTVMPRMESRPKWNQLEHLPYLVGFPALRIKMMRPDFVYPYLQHNRLQLS